jgi:hypothetical protein
VRAADLRRLGVDDVRALPEDHPARPAAVARSGGPAIQVFEHTAPDEAAAVLGRVVVAAPESGPPAQVRATWRRGPDAVSVGPLEVTGDAAVLDAPWAWDGTSSPARWAVDVRVDWDGLVLRERHESHILNPAIGVWRVRVGDGEEAVHAADPFDADFPSLADRYVVALWEAAHSAPREPLVAQATATLSVPGDRDVAFAYYAGGPVAVEVDGRPVEADVDGAGPVPNGTPHPWSRRTAPVRLAAGRHAVRFTCTKPADLAPFHLYLSACVVDARGEIVLDVIAV